MPETEMFVSIALLVGIVLVLVIALVLRTLNLRSLHKTVITAIEQGSADTPALIERLGRGPRINLRLIAYVLLAITAAMIGLGLLEGTLADLKEVVGPAMFPGFVAGAILLYLRAQGRVGDA